MLEYVEKNARIMSRDYDIWGKITEVYKLIGKARSIELSTMNLTPEQSHILRILMLNGGISTINEIADISLRTHNTVSILIKRMEKMGLVYREKKESSKQYLISITEKGSELFNTMPINSIEMIFSTLSEEDKELFSTYLDHLEQEARHILGLDYIPPLLR
ncbi:MAG TPA: MarR family transcriptional regulator [Dehalococcoidia bacterium]|nr:MarR family transcriptional regulator [Dehalococcoidia bacterium]